MNSDIDLFSCFTEDKKFGYYSAGDKIFFNRIDALVHHQQTGVFPDWKFHDDVFGLYDWTTEPIESLKQLYLKRAQQLRDKYDYIVLFFSGGADSTNVLDTFVNNNIHLDEIATYHNAGTAKSLSSPLLRELEWATYPYIKKILKSHPTIKYRTIDLSSLQYQLLNNTTSDDLAQVFKKTSDRLAPYDLPTVKKWALSADYAKIVESGKKICFLYGIDKPRVHQVNGRYCVRFMNTFSSYAVSGANDPTEFFYWSPDLPELIIKQAHVIKQYMERADRGSPYITDKTTGLACATVNDQQIWLTSHGVHALLYPTWDGNTYTGGKEPFIFYERDTWFFQLPDDDPAKKVWSQALKQHLATVPDYWKNDSADVFKGIKQQYSRDYWLEK